MNFLDVDPNTPVHLKEKGEPAEGKLKPPEQVHLFDDDAIDAINAALAARRPLLLRGEPGVGKSQMARAAARALKRNFVQFVVDAHCEPRDLLWHFDAVRRLADAQLGNALQEKPDVLKKKLDVANYVQPGPLWWAFEWETAKNQAENVKQPFPEPQYEECRPENGCVLLIDEIDKAEMDVPNGLLEALGDCRFTPMGSKKPVCATTPFPLVIITTNEERMLPPAFVRRCLVLHMDLFRDSGKQSEVSDENKPPRKNASTILIERAQAHFPGLDEEEVLRPAVEMLLKDRAFAKKEQLLPLPGQAEYLDLVRAVKELSALGKGDPETLIKRLSRYITGKQVS